MRAQAFATSRVSGTVWTSGAVLAGFQAVLVVALVAELFFGIVPLGGGHHDFLAYYSASHLVVASHPQLIYDPSAVSFVQHYVVGQTAGALGYMPFLNPPFVAAALVPLSSLPFDLSRVLWFLANAALAAAAIVTLTAAMPLRTRVACSALLITNFPMYQSFAEGQLSIVLLAGCFLAVRSLVREQQAPAGIALSVLWVKPQLALVVLAGLFFFQCWRSVLAMVATLLGLMLASAPGVGLAAYRIYPALLSQTLQNHFAPGSIPQAWSGDLSRTQGLNGLFIGWLGDTRLTALLTVGGSALAVAALVYASRRVRPGLASLDARVMIIAAISVALLVDPHLYPQDLVICLVALPLLPARYLSLATVAVLCAVLDLSAIDLVAPIHLFTLSLVAATGVAFWFAIAHREGPGPGRALAVAAA